jgi:hypothetical protein
MVLHARTKCEFEVEGQNAHIDVDVFEPDCCKWRLKGIYGEPQPEHRSKTWRLMSTLHHQLDLLWCCEGNFNEIICSFRNGDPDDKLQNEHLSIAWCSVTFFLLFTAHGATEWTEGGYVTFAASVRSWTCLNVAGGDGDAARICAFQ